MDIVRGFDDNSIDLIYLDPPFNKKKQFVAPIGSDSEGAEFKDYWELKDIKDAWLLLLKEEHTDLYQFLNLSQAIGDKSNKYYLIYMAMRLLEMKRILKPTGSIYLHCDATMGHFLKLLMDVVFGHHNFRNEIIWCYKSGGASKRHFSRKHDSIFFYTKTNDYFFEPQKEKSYGETGGGQGGKVQYFKDQNGSYSIVGMKDWWTISILSTTHPDRTGYPTQKPVELLERIILSSTRPGDMVLDPFCGCATTCVAAEKNNRQWIGIDVSKKAYELVQERLKREIEDSEPLYKKDSLIFREDIPDRTDIKTIALTGKFRREVKEKLYGTQHGNCAGCKQHFHIVHFEIDHRLPKAKGGSDEVSNLQLLCSYCNRVKGKRSMEVLLAKLAELKR